MLRADIGTASPGGLVRVGDVYAVTAASGQITLNAPAAALMSQLGAFATRPR